MVLNGGNSTASAGSATRNKILRMARELDYRPNAYARAMATGRFGCAALILNAIDEGRSTVPQELLAGICQALEERDLHLTVASLADDKLASRRYLPKILREWTSDGLLINYNKAVPPQMIQLVEEYNLPSIWLNYKTDRDCVYPDDLSAGRFATEYLLRMGHTNIAYVSYSYLRENAHYSELDRAEGYRQAMQAAGLPSRCYDRYEHDPESLDRVARAGELLSPADRPTAVLAYGETTVTPLYAAARGLGLAVPGDISLITFHNLQAMLGVGMTTMIVPNYGVGQVGVEMLLRRIEEPSLRLEPRAVPFALDEGRSCAPPRRRDTFE
jgi:LacI family transcriptional regulator